MHTHAHTRTHTRSAQVWWHYLAVIVPDNYGDKAPANWGGLWITGGSNTDGVPQATDEDMLVAGAFATGTGTVMGALFQVPNEHIVFAEDPIQQSRTVRGRRASRGCADGAVERHGARLSLTALSPPDGAQKRQCTAPARLLTGLSSDGALKATARGGARVTRPALPHHQRPGHRSPRRRRTRSSRTRGSTSSRSPTNPSGCFGCR